MIKVVGQATQSNDTSPVWTLSGICKSAARTATGTYTVTVDFLSALGITDKNKLAIYVSAERGGVGTERYVIDWTSANTFRIRNYSGYNSTTLGDCWLTITIIADIPDRKLKFDNNTVAYQGV